MGCDHRVINQLYLIDYFNPRTHRGVRLEPFIADTKEGLFQSTHPSWGATKQGAIIYVCFVHVSPDGIEVFCHPSWGATKQGAIIYVCLPNFNPRTHRGVRRFINDYCVKIISYFNPRTHRGVRRKVNCITSSRFSFQSTHPSWGATYNCNHCLTYCIFQSTHPSWGATKNGIR